MRWRKLGLIYGPDGRASWARHSALQPTPLSFDGRTRVYAGFRDEDGRSSVGYVDVDGRDPTRVLAVSREPALGKGAPDAFDRDGVVPCAVLRREGRVFLYYAGYRRGDDQLRFRVFGGLAISDDDGVSFTRTRREPVLPPVPGEDLFRVAHSVRFENGRWRVWYGAGSHFRAGAAKSLPVYDIRYMESPDGMEFPQRGTTCLEPNDREHRLGRPWVMATASGYEMYFGVGSEAVPYYLSHATSPDGVNWSRNDDALGLTMSDVGFDDRMIAYPAVVDVDGSRIIFYNGNDYGREGFAAAVLED